MRVFPYAKPSRSSTVNLLFVGKRSPAYEWLGALQSGTVWINDWAVLHDAQQANSVTRCACTARRDCTTG